MRECEITQKDGERGPRGSMSMQLHEEHSKMWIYFFSALKGQKLIAVGETHGRLSHRDNRPCKGRSPP